MLPKYIVVHTVNHSEYGDEYSSYGPFPSYDAAKDWLLVKFRGDFGCLRILELQTPEEEKK